MALVGAGRMGRVHLSALQSSSAIEVIGVVELLSATREALAAAGVPVCETVDQLLQREAPEGVLIVAPSDQHRALVATFASAGIPMLCEKPVGVRVKQTIAAVGCAREAGVLLQVGFWRRFVPELRELRARILDGELGEICQLSCMQWDAELPGELYRAHSGGISIDMGVHEFDQTRWLLGQEFEWVAATPAGPSATQRTATDPDHAAILAGLSDGASATISLGRHFPYADSCWLEIWGTKGHQRLPFMWDASGEKVFRDAILSQAEAFAAAIRGRPCQGADGADAVASMMVAESVSQSLTLGEGQIVSTSMPAK